MIAKDLKRQELIVIRNLKRSRLADEERSNLELKLE